MSDEAKAAADGYIEKRGFEPRPSSSGACASDIVALLFAKGEARLAFLAGAEWQASRPVTDGLPADQVYLSQNAVEAADNTWGRVEYGPVTDAKEEIPRQDVVLAAIEAYEQAESTASTHGGKPYAMMVAALKAAARKVRESPVTDAEVEAAMSAYWRGHIPNNSDSYLSDTMRAALEAARKVREGKS